MRQLKSVAAAHQKQRPISRRARWGYVFILPWFLTFCVFYVYPLIYGILVSFTNHSLSGRDWVGAENYLRIVGDYAFWRSLRATLAYGAIAIPLTVFLPMWAANTLRPHGSRFSTLSKMLIYLPGVTSAVALVLSWKITLLPNTGLLAQVMAMGVENVSVLDKAALSIPILAVLIVLANMGTNLIIYSASLNAIPETYYEAAGWTARRSSSSSGTSPSRCSTRPSSTSSSRPPSGCCRCS